MSEHTPTFFPKPADFRAWLEEHHATTDHLWVGYYKKATKKPSVTWEDTVGEALCYGWIDGIRKSRDDESYMIRFTPRKPRSVWSQRNIDLVERLRTVTWRLFQLLSIQSPLQVLVVLALERCLFSGRVTRLLGGRA